jgi:hypothetical protein
LFLSAGESKGIKKGIFNKFCLPATNMSELPPAKRFKQMVWSDDVMRAMECLPVHLKGIIQMNRSGKSYIGIHGGGCWSAKDVESMIRAFSTTRFGTLHMSNLIYIENNGFPLFYALPSFHLHTLRIDQCDIGLETIKVIASVLPKCQIRNLHIRENEMGKEISIIASVLPSCAHLRTLDLFGNVIGPRVAKVLATALPKTGLQSLDISCNRIQNSGVAAIAKILPQCKLRELKLHQNTVTGDGIRLIANVLPKTLLETLTMSIFPLHIHRPVPYDIVQDALDRSFVTKFKFWGEREHHQFSVCKNRLEVVHRILDVHFPEVLRDLVMKYVYF